MSNSDCFICNKHKGIIDVAGGAIYEDDTIYIGHIGIGDNEENYLGHLMLDIKRHVNGMEKLYDYEAQSIGRAIKGITASLKECFEVEHVYLHLYGDNVPHLHIHFIPRYKNAPEEFWGDNVKRWKEAPRGGRKEVEAVCGILRNYFEENY